MNNCQFHSIPKGTKVSSKAWVCDSCGEGFHEYRRGTYVSDESPIVHIVDLDSPVTCSGCGRICWHAKFGCSGSRFWTVEAIPVEMSVFEKVKVS